MTKETLKLKNTKGLFMAVHVIQSYPSNCLNREEDGSPKSCIFGGVRRSRVSSQCVKRNARLEFYKAIGQADESGMGIRTKAMPSMIAGFLQMWADSEDNVNCVATEDEKRKYHEAAKDFDIRDVMHALTAVGMKVDDKKSGALKSVYYTTMPQCEAFAKAMIDLGSKRTGEDKDGKVKFSSYENEELSVFDEALNSHLSLDIMMFGRMNAGRPIHNVEACMQVAHEISTHSVPEEYDYFTAVDDAKSMLGEQGSAHLDIAEFSSSTMYRYCNMDLGAMKRAMEANHSSMDLAVLAREWVKAFVLSAPSGKQNSFAANTLPVYVCVSFHEDAPVSYVNAFEAPVTSKGGFESASIHAFEERVKRSEKISWRKPPIATFIVSEEESELDRCEHGTFPRLLERVTEIVNTAAEKELS